MKYIKDLSSYILIILIVILIRTFIVTPVRVDGPSMNPTLVNGEILLLEKYNRSFSRFDIVVLKYNNNRLVKRIIGLPGDKVSYINDELYINGKIVDEEFNHASTANFSLKDIGYDKIPDGYYFVVGDNRTNSLDSRIFGLVKESDIQGKVIFRLLPFTKIGKIS